MTPLPGVRNIRKNTEFGSVRQMSTCRKGWHRQRRVLRKVTWKLPQSGPEKWGVTLAGLAFGLLGVLAHLPVGPPPAPLHGRPAFRVSLPTQCPPPPSLQASLRCPPVSLAAVMGSHSCPASPVPMRGLESAQCWAGGSATGGGGGELGCSPRNPR